MFGISEGYVVNVLPDCNCAPSGSRMKGGDFCRTSLAIVHVQRGRHLDFSQAVADAVKTAAERAEEVDDSLKTFMFVIPKV